MTITRLSMGIAAILLSIAGLLVCLVAVAGVWMVEGRVKAVANTVFAAADDSLVFVDAKVDRVRQAVDNSRQRMTGMGNLAVRLRDAQADAREESKPLLEAIDDVFVQLKAAESWLDSSQAAAHGIARVSEAVVSSQDTSSHEDSTGIAMAQRLQEVAEKVADALAQLQVLRQDIIEARDTGRLAREVAVRVIARVADLDAKLAALSERIDKFDTRVANTKASLGDLQRRVQGWIAMGAVTISAVFAWFALSQISMMGHGWRTMRRLPRTE